MRGNLDNGGKFVPYCDPAVIPTFLGELNETIAWLYEAGEQATLKEYETRMNHFKDIGEKIRSKYRFHDEFPDTKAAYDKLILKVEAKLAEAENLKDEDRERIISMTSATEEFFKKFQASVNEANKWDEPHY